MTYNNLHIVAFVGFWLVSVPVFGQATTPTPHITVDGRGEVDVSPDRAEILLQVETRGATGARAAESNAQLTRAIIDSLRTGARLTDRQIATMGYSLRPDMTYPGEGKAPQIVGYVATNTIRVRLDAIARTGEILDAAIRKGASGIGGISFYSSRLEAARRDALEAAVRSARSDAESIAAAAGGRLGPLVEISSSRLGAPQPVWRQMAGAELLRSAADVQTPIEPGDQTIEAHVTVRWVFIPR